MIKDEELQKNSAQMGTYMLEKLSDLREKSELIGDVRGKGLMIGIELVSDRRNRTPLAPSKMSAIFEQTKNLGLLLGKGGRFGNVSQLSTIVLTLED